MKAFAIILFSVLTLCGRAQVEDSSARQLKLQGVINFRDLGGYATTDHHTVKWGKVYRSADISKLTDSDLSVLAEKRIRYDVDLRGRDEAAKAPDRLLPGTDYIICPAGSDSSMSAWMQKLMSISSGGDSMMVVYYSNTTFLADRYKPFFAKLLILPDDQALLFHCTAGKDRTGIGAALFLYALGVPEQKIIDDYLASNYYRAADNERSVQMLVTRMHIREPVARDILSVKREYLVATFDAIRKRFGSVDIFLKEQIGLDDPALKRLRSIYLQ